MITLFKSRRVPPELPVPLVPCSDRFGWLFRSSGIHGRVDDEIETRFSMIPCPSLLIEILDDFYEGNAIERSH